MTTIEEMVRMLTFVIIISMISMILAAGSYGVVVYGQNPTNNATSTGTTKLGSLEIIANGQNATGNETSATQPGADSGISSLLGSLTIEHAGGGFTSLQTDNDNKTWIATGDWNLVSDPSKASQSNSSVVGFNATIDLRGTDNLGEHEHKISDFKLMNSSIRSNTEDSELVFNGTASVETDVGLYSDVPLSVKIYDKGPPIVSIDTQTNEMKPQWIPDGGTIVLLIDERIEDHFGSTPVYGTVKEE
jgi:hypothetical protein